MMVKDTAGSEFNAATNGKANLGVALGAVGAGLGLLNGGLGGLGFGLGGNAAQRAIAGELYQTPLSEKEYYNRTICDMKEFFQYAQGVSDRICNLEQRVAIDETAIAKNFEFMSAQNDWQNKFYDEKFRYADLLEQCRISDATCKCIKGEVYASPETIADPYIGSRLVLGTRQVFPVDYATFGGCGWNNWNTWGNGCGC